jgi:hypothetical protein
MGSSVVVVYVVVVKIGNESFNRHRHASNEVVSNRQLLLLLLFLHFLREMDGTLLVLGGRYLRFVLVRVRIRDDGQRRD